ERSRFASVEQRQRTATRCYPLPQHRPAILRRGQQQVRTYLLPRLQTARLELTLPERRRRSRRNSGGVHVTARTRAPRASSRRTCRPRRTQEFRVRRFFPPTSPAPRLARLLACARAIRPPFGRSGLRRQANATHLLRPRIR